MKFLKMIVLYVTFFSCRLSGHPPEKSQEYFSCKQVLTEGKLKYL